VFLFTDPKTGLEHGYRDQWKDDGCFHYTGEGQRGDQEMKSGNAAVVNHKKDRRALRLFRGTGGSVKYIGQFETDVNLFYFASAPETGQGASRAVIIFRLRPVL